MRGVPMILLLVLSVSLLSACASSSSPSASPDTSAEVRCERSAAIWYANLGICKGLAP